MSDSVQLPPNPAELAKSIRGIGYTPTTAIADLVDNSVAAGARVARVVFDWNGGEPQISLTDNGAGMTPAALSGAMRLGRDPGQARSAEDLGRFGMGLKTASLSQARSLTVVTKVVGGQPAAAKWDLDHIEATGGWNLLTGPQADAPASVAEVEQLAHGTQVLWRKLDLLFGTEKTVDHFLQIAEATADHLGMIFHRFLEAGRLEIAINGSPVTAWDPLASSDPNCRKLAPVTIAPGAGRGLATAAGCILPGPTVRTAEQDDNYAGPNGWIAQQGFYVYRANRMIVSGGWMNLGRGGRPWRLDREHVLARISLDVSNSSDTDWALDIRKSTVTVPPEFKPQLQRAAAEVRRLAKAALVARVKRGRSEERRAETEPVPVLIAERTGALVRFRVDRRHPLVAGARRRGADGSALTMLLDRIDADLPLQPNLPTNALQATSTVQLAVAADTIKLARGLYYSFRNGLKLGPAEARARLMNSIPQFQEHEAAIVVALESYEIELQRPGK